MEVHSGPLPHPSIIAGYEQVLPGSADRILVLVERRQRASENNDSKLLSNDRIRIYGIILGHLVTVGVIGISAWLGNTVLAISLSVAGVASALMGHVYEERRQNSLRAKGK